MSLENPPDRQPVSRNYRRDGPPLGGRSSPRRLARLDGRSLEARRIKEIKRELTEHLGGPEHVTAPQKYLIERTAIDLLRLELLDVEMATGGLSDHDARVAHALRNTIRLALRDLHGLGRPARGGPKAIGSAPQLAEMFKREPL